MIDRRPVHVVIVAYHAPADLRACLDTVSGARLVTVVDNSQSEAVRVIVENSARRYLDSGANIGFAAAVNLALQSILDGEAADVLLLNPDARIDVGGIARLQQFLHEPGRDRVAAVSPILAHRDGIPQRVEWPFPTPSGAALEALGLGRVSRNRTYVIGAVLLLRWEALLDVGLFDEGFFLYGEETDWQRRAAARGWLSSACHAVRAVHEGAGTSDDLARRDALFHAAHETYIRKWHGRAGWLVYRCAAIAGAVARTAVLRGQRRKEAARRAMLYARGPRRAAGFS